jgi:hypothetical protein
VKKEAMRFLEALPDAVDNINNLIREMKALPKEDYKSRGLSYRASLKALEAAGIVNTQAQNQVMINIFNNNQTIISPVIETVLDKLIADFPEDPIEYEQAKNNELQ